MEAQPPDRQHDGRQLFGTLLASQPRRSRSPLALVVSVVLHVVVVVLLVAVSRPFVPRLAHKIFEQVTIIVPEDPQLTIPSRAPASSVVAARPGSARRGEELRYVPGPIGPIPEITAGPETVEPADDGGGRGEESGGSLADRLRPRTVDPRLSGAARYAPSSTSPLETVRERVGQSLQAYNDSAAADAEARRRALDWTIKTKDGKQWGIGPDGKIHLGDITLPAIAFSPPAGRREEIAARTRDFAEIERQAAQEIGRQSFKERVKAVRARRDKEREEAKKKKESDNAPITN